MQFTVNLHPRMLITLVVALVALVGGFALAQAPAARAAMEQAGILAAPVLQEVGIQAVPVSVPKTFNYQGLLRKADGTLDQGPTYNITAKIYDAASGGNVLYTETFNNVPVRDGVFNLVLGDGVSLGTALDNLPRYIGISLNNGSEIIPRERIHAVPWAIFATNSAKADNATNATFATAASSATNASNASNATFAASAGSAATVSNIDHSFVEADNKSNGASQLIVDLPFTQDDSTGMCMLYHVETSSSASFTRCYINYISDELVAGQYSKCVAMCLRWDGISSAGFGVDAEAVKADE